MSSFGGDNLFDSGPHRFEIGGLALRPVIRQSPGSRGAGVTSQGVTGRSIVQHGELIADDVATLDTLARNIEAKLDGQARTLVDEHGRTWPYTIMLEFKPTKHQPIGTRWRLAYRIEYLQTTP